MRLVVYYVAASISLALMLSAAGGLSRYKVLATSGVRTEGVVVKLSCEDHATLSYRFEVAGQTIVSKSHVSGDCRDAHIADVIPVYYLPANPSINMSEVPANAVSDEYVSIGLASTLIPAFGMWSYLRRRRQQDQA